MTESDLAAIRTQSVAEDSTGATAETPATNSDGLGAERLRISGRMTAETGSRISPCFVVARCDGADTDYKQLVDWREMNGMNVGVFLFDLPMGTYSIDLIPPNSFKWTPRRYADLSCDQTELIFTCHDTSPCSPTYVEVSDALTGQAVGCYLLVVRRFSEGRVAVVDRLVCMSNDRAVLQRYPVDAPLGWFVSAVGYVPAEGIDQAVIDGTVPDVRRIAVELDPGWGVRLEPMWARDVQTPEQFVVQVDGLLYGSFKSSEQPIISWPHKPREVLVYDALGRTARYCPIQEDEGGQVLMAVK